MSSRSIGVTNVLFTSWTISWVTAVALVLAILDLVDQGAPVGVVLEQVEQELRRRDEVGAARSNSV